MSPRNLKSLMLKNCRMRLFRMFTRGLTGSDAIAQGIRHAAWQA